ncbi:MAG: hypothetical protein V3U74_04020 [Thermodesulfobacteriota bacterium]
MRNKSCPRCDNKKSWKIRRAKLRCSKYRYEWVPNKLPPNLTRTEWKKVLRYFLLGLSGNKIATETGVNRKRVLRVLTKIREVIYVGLIKTS